MIVYEVVEEMNYEPPLRRELFMNEEDANETARVWAEQVGNSLTFKISVNPVTVHNEVYIKSLSELES